MKLLKKKITTVSEMFDHNNPNSMNKSHEYYFQVQGQLHAAKKNFAILLHGHH